MEVIVTSKRDLQRIVNDSVEAATAKVLSQVQQTASGGMKEWLSNKEAQAFLGLSKTSLQRYRTSGRLPYSKVGGNIYYKYSDLVAVLEANLVK